MPSSSFFIRLREQHRDLRPFTPTLLRARKRIERPALHFVCDSRPLRTTKASTQHVQCRICLFLLSLLRRFTLVSVRWLVITHHSRALTPTKHYAKDRYAHLPPYLAIGMLVTVLSSKVMPRHVNMHITIAGYIALLSFGFAHRLHASAFRLHAKRRSERASLSKGLLHESHQLFVAESISSDLHHMRLPSCLFLIKSTLVCGSSCCSYFRLAHLPRKGTSWLHRTLALD